MFEDAIAAHLDAANSGHHKLLTLLLMIFYSLQFSFVIFSILFLFFMMELASLSHSHFKNVHHLSLGIHCNYSILYKGYKYGN